MAQVIRPGDTTPFMVGLDTVRAEVLGLVRDGEQYLLRLEYIGLNHASGKNELIIQEFQRDRSYIEGLYRDAGGTIPALRVLRNKNN